MKAKRAISSPQMLENESTKRLITSTPMTTTTRV